MAFQKRGNLWKLCTKTTSVVLRCQIVNVFSFLHQKLECVSFIQFHFAFYFSVPFLFFLSLSFMAKIKMVRLYCKHFNHELESFCVLQCFWEVETRVLIENKNNSFDIRRSLRLKYSVT